MLAHGAAGAAGPSTVAADNGAAGLAADSN
jgi:hypothetical protein